MVLERKSNKNNKKKKKVTDDGTGDTFATYRGAERFEFKYRSEYMITQDTYIHTYPHPHKTSNKSCFVKYCLYSENYYMENILY